MPTITKAPAVANSERTSPPVRGNALGLAVTASTATVEPGDTAPGSTMASAAVVVAPGAVVVVAPGAVEVVEAAVVVVAPGSFTVTTGAHEHDVEEMVVVVVAILGELMHGLGIVSATGVVVTSLPFVAAASLTNRS
jgi:hypothetical protein